MEKTLHDILEGVQATVIGNGDEPVSGIAYRSNEVHPGDAFFCIVGTVSDGHSYAQDAIDHGAKSLVVERKVYLADATDVTEAVVSDTRKAMAQASVNFYDDPSDDFALVGITGTNGKTTTTYLVQSVVEHAGKRCGVIGTVGVSVGGVREKAERTTPESPDLQRLFARMRDAHEDVVAMEVSSHALDLDRTWGSHFAVTAFTNLTQDHLDYHHTFEAYFEAKARLFSSDYPAKRVICIDDAWGGRLLERCSAAGDAIVTTGFNEAAQIHPVSVDYHDTHTSIVLDVRGQQVAFDYPLVGRFNVENVMTAFGVGLSLGIPAAAIAQALREAPQVPGRLQRVPAPEGCDVSVFVDYAHTPDALVKALSSVKEFARERTLVVFGCGGDRDATKRPLMGHAALAADFAYVTSDNPRSEDPNAIIEDIVAGMGTDSARYQVQPDRGQAIREALAAARPGDAVLIAGKGHEDYQIIGSETIHFDDCECAAAALADLYGSSVESRS